jgi:serine/threonine-protein kinase RsbW
MGEGKICLEIRNKISELDSLRSGMETLGRTFGLSKKCLFQINLAIEEVFSNIISYGYTDQAEHWIKINIWHQDKTLNVRIEDDGIPFNPVEAEMPDFECPVEERRIGGLGCYFMRCFMDDVRYQRVGDKNVLTMKKRITEIEPN